MDIAVEGEHDHRTMGDTAQLAEPGLRVGPMVDGQHGQGRVEGIVAEGKPGCHGTDRRCSATRPLGDHGHGRFDSDHLPVAWLIGTRAGPDVDDPGRAPQARVQGALDARVGLADPLISDSDGVIESRAAITRHTFTVERRPVISMT